MAQARQVSATLDKCQGDWAKVHQVERVYFFHWLQWALDGEISLSATDHSKL